MHTDMKTPPSSHDTNDEVIKHLGHLRELTGFYMEAGELHAAVLEDVMRTIDNTINAMMAVRESE